MSPPEVDLDIQRVNQICLPLWKDRINSVILRPERPEYAIRMGTPPDRNWIRVLQRLQHVKLCIGMQFYASHSKYEPLPLCRLLDKLGLFSIYEEHLTAALQFTSAIIYDQECSGNVKYLENLSEDNAEKTNPKCSNSQFAPGDMYKMRGIIEPLFEHMLLIDYGIEKADDLKLDLGSMCDTWPTGRQEFDDLCDALMEWAQRFPFKICPRFTRCIGRLNINPSKPGYTFDFSDLALMLYYYNTHRKPVSAVDYENGITGYCGVLQELISQVPFQGTSRLQRKLSVDVNELIPKTVKDPEKQQMMISIARKIAMQHNIALQAPTWKIPKPPFEMRYWEGCRWRDWPALLKVFFGSLLLSKSRARDKELGHLINKELPPGMK